MPRKLSPRFIGSLLGLSLVATASMVVAAETPTENNSFEQQWYLGAGLGRSYLKPDTDGTGFRVDDKNDIGYKLFGGYDFTGRLSFEGYFSQLGKANFSPNGEMKYRDFGFSALYYIYKSQQPHEGWGVFARAGMGRMQNSTDVVYERDNDNHAMFGAGVEYGFANGLVLRADADLYDSDAQLFAINVIKRFGASKKKARPVVVIDSDNDGVTDSSDKCPHSHAGVKVNSRGCELDSDNDGVSDSHDLCLETVAGAKVDARGCEMDADGDGIVDRLDRCPATSAGVTVDAQGCELKTTFVLKGVTFATASAELIGSSQKALDEVRDTLQLHPEIKVEVAGYTDSRGLRKFNVGLSQRRAEAVRDYLVAKGIAADRLTAKGYGPDKPITDNETSSGQADNRRVEIRILN